MSEQKNIAIKDNTGESFRLEKIVGKPVYSFKQNIQLLKYNPKTKKWSNYKTLKAGSLIGKLADYKLDITGVIPNDLKTLKNAKVWLIFKNGNLIFGFPYKPNTNQISFTQLKKAGIISDQKEIQINKQKYNTSPVQSIKEGLNSFTKNKIFPFAIGAGILFIILNFKND